MKHIVTVLILVALLAPQIGVSAAGAIAVIARLWTTVIEIVPAALFWARGTAAAADAEEEVRDG